MKKKDKQSWSQSKKRHLVPDNLEASANLAWIVDNNYNVIATNGAYDERTIYYSTAGPHKASHILVHELNNITCYDRALRGATFTEVEYDAASDVWTEISYTPIRKGNQPLQVLCVARDVTAAKKEETHLKLMESVVINATDAILISEIDSSDKSGTKIVFVNDALTKMTGYTKEEIIGRTPDMLYGEKSDKQQLAFMKECFERSTPCEIEIVNYKKNGEEFWIHLAMAPVYDHNGQFMHFITIGRDVTERLKNSEAVKAQNMKLMAIARIQSHEVRGPLARIKGLIELLGQHPCATDESELIGYLKISADELDGVIKRITGMTEAIQGFHIAPKN